MNENRSNETRETNILHIGDNMFSKLRKTRTVADSQLLSDGISAIRDDPQTNTSPAFIQKVTQLLKTFKTTHLKSHLAGGRPSLPYAPCIEEQFDPEFDYDFSDVQDDGETYMRGGYVYKRPYGWKRFGIKVLGKYKDDDWLGSNGLRTWDCEGEWPVSYHGTNASSANKILKDKFKAGPRKLHGEGIYTSPCLEMVEELYAQQFIHKGKTYNIVLQVRVNPENLKIIPASETGVEADYWLSPESEDDNVRLYGILIREDTAT